MKVNYSNNSTILMKLMKPSYITTEKFLRRVAADIGEEWYRFSLSLGLTEAEVERIQYDGTCDPETKIVKTLLKWRSKSSNLSARAQLEELIKALQENGRKDLADKYGASLLEDISTEKASRHEDEKTQRLLNELFAINDEETERIPVSPLQNSGSLSVSEIYAPVYIKEDLEYKRKGRNIGQKSKPEKKSKKVNDPNEIFYIKKGNKERTRHLILLGDAGHGKTVFCRQLLRYWCQTFKKRELKMHGTYLDEWEESLSEFEFLFHVKLRHVDDSRTSLIDMICHDVFERHPECHETIRQVLLSGLQNCLVVVDGLDEWKITTEAKTKLKHEGLPNLDGMGNSTILWTSRQWKFDEIIGMISSKDKVLEIHGLDEKGIDILVHNILTNFYAIDICSFEYYERKTDIAEKIRDTYLKDLMRIPLVAVACIHIWSEKKTVGKSITNFYMNLIDLLISRAIKKKDITELDIETLLCQSKEGELNLQSLAESDYALDFLPVLEKLEEIAFNDLISKEKNLVFRKRQLKKILGKPILELALKVGLLTQCEAPGSFNEEKISVNFFHQSMQEFLAAFHVATGRVPCESFCSSLKDIQVVFEFENILLFLSGFNSKDGNLLLRHIGRISDSDPEVLGYRTILDYRYQNKLKMLYKLQMICLKEMKNTERLIKTDEIVISDVYIDEDSDVATIQSTVDVLLLHNSFIKSLTLSDVDTGLSDGISNEFLSDILETVITVKSLCIRGSDTKRSLCRIFDVFYSLTSLELSQMAVTWDVLFALPTALSENKLLKHLGLWKIEVEHDEEIEDELPAPLSGLIQILPSLSGLISLSIGTDIDEEKILLLEVLQKLCNLHVFNYYGSYDDIEDLDDTDNDALIASTAVVNCPMLRRLGLNMVSMGTIPLQMNSHLEKIDFIDFTFVKMSDECWENFVLSLMEVNHEVTIELHETDISEKCQILLSRHGHFQILKSEIDSKDVFIFEFIKLKQ